MLPSRYLTLIVLSVLFSTDFCQSYRLLGIFPFKSRTHMMMFEALMKSLAKKGHEVDVVSLFPQKKPIPNYTDIVISSHLTHAFVNNLSFEYFQDMKRQTLTHFLTITAGNDVCENVLKELPIQKLLKNTKNHKLHYDAVIVQLLTAHCFMAFGHLLKVPIIAVSSSAVYPWGNDLIGNPENLAFVPNNLLDYRENMNFWERLFNVLHTAYSKMYSNYYSTMQNELIQKYFGSGTPGVRELEQSVALVLVNSHFSINGVKPTTPALIEVGGIHIDHDHSDIPEEDKKWLDESTSGFIYFTFGSMVTIETFPESVLSVLYKSLAKIAPVRVFIKIPKPEKLPAGLPSNIRTFQWMPQLAVLKHKNIRAFITHGGLMSTQEAISCAVPMIGVPLFADQHTNINSYVRKNIALRLDYTEMTEEKLDMALNEILYNPIYRETVANISRKFLDRPQSPRDTAVYWVEYVIRHGDKVLRSPALDLTWWQIALLDVYLFLFTVCLFITMIVIYFIRFYIRKIIKSRLTVSNLKKSN